MVPVTQMPPNSAEPILAAPCATSSLLERWRRPLMPSATTAESSESMAPSSAKAAASGSTAWIFASVISGNDGIGLLRGMPPKRVPMVSTGSASSAAATAVITTAISIAGHVGFHRRTSAMMAMVATETLTAPGLMVPLACASASSLGISSPGSLPDSVMPSRSRIWLAKMMTAMPAVKPTVTG